MRPQGMVINNLLMSPDRGTEHNNTYSIHKLGVLTPLTT